MSTHPTEPARDSSTFNKTFQFGKVSENGGEMIEITIHQNLVESDYGCFVWPASTLIAEYLWFIRDKIGKNKLHILELGCGTGLPGLVAAACGSRVTLTDDFNRQDILDNVRACFEINRTVRFYRSTTSWTFCYLQARIVPFSWSQFLPSSIFAIGSPFQLIQDHRENHFTESSRAYHDWPGLIIASDCFYDNVGDYEKILATIDYFITKNSQCRFITSYQIRDENISYLYLLSNRWNLVISEIPYRLEHEEGSSSDQLDQNDSSGVNFCFQAYKYHPIDAELLLLEFSRP